MKIVTAPPQCRQIVEHLKKEIRTGAIRPGDRLESIRTLAERFGVGRQVVLSAFQELQQGGVLETQVGRGTFVKHSPLTNHGRINLAFCVRLSGLAWFYNRAVFLGAALKSEELNINLTIAPGDAGSSPAGWCREHGMDGLLITGQLDDATVTELNKSGLPYLILGTYEFKEPAYTLTGSSDLSIELCRKAFKEYPVRRPGMILGDLSFYSTRKLLEKFQAIATESGLKIPERHIYSSYDEDGYEGMKKLMTAHNPPDLLYIVGRAFPGAARYIFEHGGKRPVIISPCSEDLQPLYPELIDIPIPQRSSIIGSHGVELLCQFIKDGTPAVRQHTITENKAHD